MKVLHLWDSYAPGLFDHSFEICREEGVDARLVCMHLVERGQPAPSGVAHIRRVDDEDWAHDLAGRFRRKLRSLVDRTRFRRLARKVVREFEPDIIHFHYGTTAAIFDRERDVIGHPFIISFYGFDISQAIQVPAIRSAYRRMMRLRPLIHVLCQEAAERAAALGAAEDLIVEANLPLPVERYPYVGIDDGCDFRWLMPARFVEKKGHAVALKAFQRHLQEQPESRLTCWGYGHSGWLRNLVERLGLDDHVAVVDNEAEGPFDAAYLARLREHDAVLAPSVRSARGDDEGGPALTAVLAQVAGKPVIVSDFPGHERSVTNEVEGLVVPQGDTVALTEAMAALSADCERARAMGKAGRERAIRAFDRRAYRDALLSWYRRLAP